MKRFIFCGLCIAVGALALAASASARAPHHPATLFFDGSDSLDTTTIWVAGHLTSPSQRCLAKRTIKISYDYDVGSFTPVDVGKSSANGFFAGAGPATQNGNVVARAKFKLVAKTFTKRGRKHICEGDTLVVD